LRRLCIAFIFTLLVCTVTYAVPYPYSEYTIEDSGDWDKIHSLTTMKYAVWVESENKDFGPWSEFSVAILSAPEAVDVLVNYTAHQQFLTEKEQEELRETYFYGFVDHFLSFVVLLKTDDFQYGWFGAETPKMVLETDAGDTYNAAEIVSGDPSQEDGLFSTTHTVAFPRYKDETQIINEDTEWVRLWVISGLKRVSFILS
jgi:hypothetical protein